MITVFGEGRGFRVVWLLEEMGLAYRLRPVDLLVGVEEDGRGLTRSEIIATAVLLMQAGHETTADLIGNSIVGLLRHPDQLDLLSRQPHLMRMAVEEFLRYDGSVQVNHRLLRQDMRFGDVVVPAGDVVLIVAPVFLEGGRRLRPHEGRRHGDQE